MRTLHERVAHQQAPVAATPDAEVLHRRELGGYQTLSHSVEVVVGSLPVALESSLMPGRPELAPAADVGDNISTPPLQPRRSDLRRSMIRGMT